MESSLAAYHAYRCGFSPGRKDSYLRLSALTVFVRDLRQSLRFYQDQLGFILAFDEEVAPGARLVAVSPPDGTAVLELAEPGPHSEEYGLIGRPTQAVFLTEDIFAKFDEWRRRGVRFRQPPQAQPWGATTATFEDVDGNSFTLMAFEKMTQELNTLRHQHVEQLEIERHAALELEMARETQTRLLPQTAPALKSLECHAVCLQAKHVGGDYYDFLDLDRGRVGLVIGDVSGKGTAAALLMANLQAHLHNLCGTYWSRPFTPFVLEQPARFLQTVNRLFYESTRDSAYATLFFAEYDDRSRRLRYANCGHPPALLLRHDRDFERLDSTSSVLGLSRAWDCGVGERELLPGDILVLYTDGVSESANDCGEEFGEFRLMDALRRYRQLPLQPLVTSLASELRQFSPHSQHDDVTLLVARCVGD